MDHLDSLFDSEYVFTYQGDVLTTNVRCAVISVMYKLIKYVKVVENQDKACLNFAYISHPLHTVRHFQKPLRIYFYNLT